MNKAHQLSLPRTRFLAPKFWPVWLGCAVLWTIAQLPYRWQMQIGHGFGWLLGKSMSLRRHFAEVNLRLCFPAMDTAAREDILQRQFISFGMGVVETAMSWWSSDDHLHPLIASITGLEYLQEAKRQGKGVLLLSAHFASLELGGRLLASFTQFAVSYREHKKKPLFNEIMLNARKYHYEDAISARNPRGIINALKQGKILWYAPDQDYGKGQSVFAPFFGVPAATTTATARIAKISQACVIPFHIKRLDENRGYALTLDAPLTNFPGDLGLADAQRVNGIIEQWILADPEQYLWIHRRFKTRPEGEEKVYRPKKRREKRRKQQQLSTPD